MSISIDFAGFGSAANVFLGYTPIQVTLTVQNRPTPSLPLTINVTSTGASTGAKLSFFPSLPSIAANSISLALPPNENTINFFVGGRFESWSTALNDGELTATIVAGSQSITGNRKVSVRVRRDANKMNATEVNRLLAAFAKVNNKGNGIYQALRDMHTSLSSSTIHGGPRFLPWHRALILHLERELQSFEPLTAVPYWRFDLSAPKIFSAGFMGATTRTSNMVLAPTNPLTAWVTDGQPLWARRWISSPPSIRTQSQTLALGTAFSSFMNMEGDPHGSAHVQFNGPINNIGTAVKDPLFFLLHCNVDRLWAIWQLANNRYGLNQVASYPVIGTSNPPPSEGTLDAMWPWNGQTGTGWPPTAPGGPFPGSPSLAAPGATPTIGSMIDYQGKISRANVLGFDYDTVPY